MYSEEERKNDAEEPDWLKTEKEQFSRYRDKNGDGFMGKVKKLKMWKYCERNIILALHNVTIYPVADPG